jgi:hypothetical protein
MRLIKMLGLAAVAAMAVMAFAVASASADSSCNESGLHAGECKSVYTGSLKGLTPAGEPALLLGPELRVEEKCHGETLVNQLSNEGSHKGLLLLGEPLKFGLDAGGAKCEGLCTEVKGENASLLLLEALTLDLWVSKDPSAAGAPAAKFQGCPLGATCLYTLLSEPQLLTGTGSQIIADHIKLNRTQGTFCPSEGFWDAKYNVTKDEVGGAPLFAAALP